MVETRKRNSSGPAKSTPAPQSAASSEDEDDYQPGSSGDEFVEGSSNNKKRKRAQNQPKPKSTPKRAGKAGPSQAKGAGNTPVGSVKAGGKRRKTLSLLPTMPIDVLYEILGQLSPKDLLNIFRTNSLFKSTLEASDAKTIWIKARRQFDAPEPPPGFNEPQWAKLLFEPKCGKCGANNVHDADWKIQKRLCSSCKLAHLTGSRDKWFPKEFQGYHTEIFRYLPWTSSRPFPRETRDPHYDTRKLYWDDDVHVVARKWKALKAVSHTSRGQEELETWKSKRLAYVASCDEMAPTYSDWERQYRDQKEDETTMAMISRKEGVAQRFLSLGLGYTRSDIETAFFWKPQHTKGTANITTRVWNILRPKLEPDVQEAKANREENARKPLVASRRQVLDDLYGSYLDNLRPFDRYCCPPSSVLHALPTVWQVLDVAQDIVVTQQDFQPVAAEFPNAIRTYQNDLKTTLVRPLATRSMALGSLPSSVQPLPLEDAERSLSLAKHVFRCEAAKNQGWGGDFWMTATGLDQTLLGWACIASHRCGKVGTVQMRPGVSIKKPQCNIVLHEQSSPLSEKLIALAGLDPATATLTDMHARDARFGVVQSSVPGQWTKDYLIFTWRGALHYFADEYHRHGLDPPTFRLATDEEAETSRRHSSSRRTTVKAWSCNHCQEFFAKETAETELIIAKHIKERHDIANPQANESYVVNPHLWHLLEAPCPIPLQFTTPLHLKCTHCSYSSTERFDLNGVQGYIQQLHNRAASPGKDFAMDRDLITLYPG